MMKKLLSILGIVILIVFSLVTVTITACKGKESKTPEKGLHLTGGRAISLNILQKKVEECMAKGTCSEDILQLCGIKRVMGYVIDEKNRDIILFGETDDTMPPLYLEDFVIALRNTWMKYAELKGNTYYYSNPGCSIDPDPNVLNNLQQIGNQIFSSSNPDKVQRNLTHWHNVCQQPQQVRVLGIPYDTRFGKVMVEADYYMKRLVDGSVTLDIDGFTSLIDMTLNIARKEIEKSKPVSVPLSSLNRFWFYPGENSYLEDKGVMYIKKSDIKLLNEEEFLTRRGELAGTGRPNPFADKFAQSFSERYAEIAKRKPIYSELESLFRFVAFARIMKHRNAISEAGISLDYLMNRYPVERTPVSHTLPGISNIKEFKHKSEIQGGYSVLYLWLPSCGGVSIDINIKDSDIGKDRTRSLAEIKKSILNTRPSPDALYWDFQAKLRASSSPITKKGLAPTDKIETTSIALTGRLEDIKKAGRNIKNGLIIDLFVGEKDVVHANIVDAGGNVHGVNPEASKEFRKLLNITATIHGKIGSSLLSHWQRFYDTNLSHLSKPTSWTCPDGRPVKIKPVLIIKSNEVSYKYANLEKVPALADNFVIFIASKIKESKDVSETSAKDLVSKINDVPMLSRDNVVFAIRLPEMRKEERARWENEITKLERVVGKENVLFNLSKKDFNRMLQDRSKEMIVIELTHTDRGMTLRDNERYISKDLLQCGDLSHIKYLMTGPGTCSLPRLEKGDFAAILRGKGVGIMNTSYREVSTEIALKRLRELIHILRDVEKYNLPAYYLPDMIDQLIGISSEGTTNLGKLDYRERDVLG